MVMIRVVMGIMALAVLCCIAGFFFNIFEYENEDNIVITFLGALASFVVISNYAQMVEVRNTTNRELDKMRDELGVLYKRLEQFKDLSSKTEESFMVDINRIKLAVANESSYAKIVELLDELNVYEDISSPAIRKKIVEVLAVICDKAAQSGEVSDKVMDIAFMLAPMDEKENEVLVDIFRVGYDLIEKALHFSKPKNGAYGFTIMKLVAKITKDATEAKDYLNSLKNKFKDDLKIRYIDTFIKDLDNSNLSWPRFDKDVQEWFDKNGNN